MENRNIIALLVSRNLSKSLLSRLYPLNHAMVLSTIHRIGWTENRLFSSLRFMTSNCSWYLRCAISISSPLYPPSAMIFFKANCSSLSLRRRSSAVFDSCCLALWTRHSIMFLWVSTARCLFRPVIFLFPSYPLMPPNMVVFTDWQSIITVLVYLLLPEKRRFFSMTAWLISSIISSSLHFLK